ncbi:MAG: putative formyl-CoA transferase [Ilumatobacteraceae bacterium]|nr:putative formyl-CoA transferase [Ilumatobacteraceae bacterium]
MSRPEPPPALSDVRVLDCSTGIAGPLAAMLFADFGADVVKVEGPSGDPARARPDWVVWNRGKRGVTIDQDDPADRDRLRGLLADADVCIANAPIEELRGGPLDPAAATAAHPRLVFLHVPPYTDSAPWAGGAESNALLHAISGLAMNQGSWTAPPVDAVADFVLVIHGMWAAAAAAAALRERARSGAGQVVTVSGMHSVAVSAGSFLTFGPDSPRRSRPAVGGGGGSMPYYRLYRCADGQWLFLGALSEAFTRAAFEVLGVSDILIDERLGGRGRPAILEEANAAWAIPQIADAIAERPAAEWLELLDGACATSIAGRRDAWLDHPQLDAIGMRVEVDDPQRGRVVMPGVPLRLSRTPGAVTTAAPDVDRRDATTDWEPRAGGAGGPAGGVAAGDGATSMGGPLAGVRVLDLGAVLAGPLAGMLLAELGADVIKVEPPAGDSYRGGGFAQYNKGQRGLVLDIRDEAGRAAFLRVVETSDVVIDNYRSGVLERLRITHDDLRQVNPGIISASITGFGDGGPLGDAPGFDPILQTMSGMVSSQGGDDEPVMISVPSNDVAAATTIAFGVVTALLARDRDGVGQRVSTSLAAMATTIQASDVVRFDGRTPPRVGGRDHPGQSPAHRFYAVADGWIFLASTAHEDEITAALGAAPRQATPIDGDGEGGDDDASVARLAGLFADLSTADALQRLGAARLAAAPARGLREVAVDPELTAFGLFRPYPAPGFERFVTTGEHARFSRSTPPPTRAAPRLGEHSAEVLRSAGLDEAAIAGLLTAGVAVQAGPPPPGVTTLE